MPSGTRRTRAVAPETPVQPAPTASEELFAPVGRGIELCYQTFGDPDDDPLLLVMGLGGPMTWWDVELCEDLARAGFFVIRYDHRDTGRSTVLDARVSRAMVVRAFAGTRVRAPYGLGDLADDAFGLLDHLGLESAHVVGVSMGGMVAQTMALARPQRVRSLTSIMSTTGKRTVGWQHPAILPRMLVPTKAGREAYLATSVTMSRLIGSPAYPEDEERIRARAALTLDRGLHPAGVVRQMLAILTQPNRGSRLRGVRVPTLVVHGLADKMVHVSGGRATAAAVPGAELLLIDGMGHDLPVELFETFVAAIRRTADRAK